MSRRPKAGESQAQHDTLSRRTFLRGAGGIAAGGVLARGLAEAQEGADGPETLAGEVEIELSINGAATRLTVEPRTSLLSALRHRVDPPLTGAKLVCDMGSCGACTVLVDDRPVYACLQLAADMVDRRIRTVEGLGTPDALSPVQEAFCAEDALMCGFCTPGFVVAATACLERNPAAGDPEIRRALSGNLCRCGTYPYLFAATKSAGERLRAEGRKEGR